MRPLKDSERLASSYMYESGGKKRHCSETADQRGELYEESRIYRFFKTDSSEKPHMYANKNHIFKLHMVLWDFFLSAGKPPGIVWDIVELLFAPQSSEARRLQARDSSCYRVILHQLQQHVFLFSNLLQYRYNHSHMRCGHA